jgi:3-hydroxybutyryl-CoA dehydrogenase
MSAEHIKTVGIAGVGTMGQGIAQLCATSGFDVLLYDVRA